MQGGCTPYERAKLRGLLSKDLNTFQVERTRQLLGMLMHLSLLLYSVGLIIFIFHIDPQLVFMAGPPAIISLTAYSYTLSRRFAILFLELTLYGNTSSTAVTWRVLAEA